MTKARYCIFAALALSAMTSSWGRGGYAPKTQYVSGYSQDNGSYVAPYWRSTPNLTYGGPHSREYSSNSASILYTPPPRDLANESQTYDDVKRQINAARQLKN